MKLSLPRQAFLKTADTDVWQILFYYKNTRFRRNENGESPKTMFITDSYKLINRIKLHYPQDIGWMRLEKAKSTQPPR